jgi:hypothetical protein
MSNQVATELLRDFLKMLGPKIPHVFREYTVTPETTLEGGLYYVYKFVIPDELKKELDISDNMLPMFASSMETILLSKMVNKGVGGKISVMLKFIQELPKFKKTIDSYFKKQNVNTVFEFV